MIMGDERLHHRPGVVNPAVRARRLDHRVLAADLVGGDRLPEFHLHPGDHVEVRERRFQDDDVGALREIDLDLAQRLRHVAGVHLVTATIAELRRGIGGVAKRSVEGRAVLRGIRHDAHPLEPALVERLPDRAHAAVHHVRGSHEVGAGGGVRQRRLHQLRDGHVVDDLLAVEDAAVAVRGVLAEAHVGDHHQVGHLALERAHGGLHRRLRIGGERAARVLCRRQPEQQHAGHALRLGGRRLLDRLVHRQLVDAGHRPHLAAHAVAFADEQGIDERVGGEVRFAHQPANRAGAAQPARTPRQRQSGGGLDGHLSILS
jgi:hypothetical protein